MTVAVNGSIADILINAKFTAVDYGVYGSMLVLSAATGLYFGLKSSKTSNVQDYLLGNRNMRTFPVAMSLIGSYISGVTILGTPAEIYNFGTQYWLIVAAIFISGIIVASVYLPVFCKLKLHSSYEYLEMRFDKTLRTLASVIFLFDEIMFLPVLVYVPALAFNQVTGINIHIVSSTVCLVCIFYTVLGGLRAVVWTDTWQVAVMFGAVLIIAVIGTIEAGGISDVISAASKGYRLELWNWNTSLFQRHTAWGVLFGGTLYWTAFNSVNQTMVQRYMALPSLRKAVISVILFSTGAVFVVSLCCYSGLLIYERLGKCDPRSTGQLHSDDQLLPAYVALTAGHIPGLLGIFVAGIFGAALSSMSVILNSSATVVLEDIVHGLAGRNPGPKLATFIAKATATILGLISLVALLLVERLSGVLSVATSLSAIAASSTFGMFTLGMLWPWATARGSLIGAIAGYGVGAWAALGTQAAAAQGLIPPDRRLPSFDGCSVNFNITMPEDIDPSVIFPLYRISYHWIAPLGLVTTLLVGIIASAFTYNHGSINELDPDLLSPIIHKFLPLKIMKNAGKTLRKYGKNDVTIIQSGSSAGELNHSIMITLIDPENVKLQPNC